MVPAESFVAPDEVPGRDFANGALSTWVTASGALEWRSRVCPLPIAGDAAGLLQLYEWWGAKVLPMAGGLLDQPNRFLRAMALLERRFALQRKETK